MVIAISVSAVMREIYAISALRACQSKQYLAERPRLLTRDNEMALRPVVADALSIITCALSRWVRSTDLTDPEAGEIVHIEFAADAVTVADAHLLRRCIEHAAVHDTLAVIWSENDTAMSSMHRERSRESVDKIHDMLGRMTNVPVKIKGWRY